MSRFATVLRRAESRLALPQPARGRVLLEMAADLEDLFDAYRDQGLDAEEAHRRAVERIDLSDDSLAGLAAVHRSPVRRLMDRLSERALARWEYGMLAGLVLVYLLAAWQLTGSRRVLVDAGVFAWPVLLLALTAGLLIIEKSYRIFVKQDHDPRRLRRGMNLLPGLLAGLILLGFSGSWYRALRIIAGSAGDTRPYAAILIDWGIQATALLQVSLSAAVLGALMWFLLADRIGRIEKDEAAALLCE